MFVCTYEDIKLAFKNLCAISSVESARAAVVGPVCLAAKAASFECILDDKKKIER